MPESEHTPRWLERFRRGAYDLEHGPPDQRVGLESLPPTARQRLVESSGTPFAPASDVRPVVEVIDGRKRNDEIEPAAWRRALEATAGSVAVYLGLEADHEWWLAYDPAGKYPGDFDGPYHWWTTYPSGGWDHSATTSGMLEDALENVYGEDGPDMECSIYRSRVVCLEDAPAFVRREVSDRE